MFKFGIHKKEQLTPKHLDGFLNSRKFIALDLYTSLDDYPPSDRDRIQERMLCKFSNQNGTFRYTHARRFEQFDSLALNSIRSAFPPGQPIRVHDVGASDGRTSCDFYEALTTIYAGQLSFLASDYAPFYYVVRRKNDGRRIILDERDNVLQIVTPPFVFNVVHPENRYLYPVNRVVRHFVNSSYVRSLLRAYKGGDPNIERTRFDLLCSECRSNCASKDNFRFISYDIFSPSTEHFDVIRAMNVLNLVYFSETNLKKAISNIIACLNEGGVLVTGSNLEAGSMVNGGIYKRSGRRLEKLATSGSGSQVDNLIKTVNAEDLGSSRRPLEQCGISS